MNNFNYIRAQSVEDALKALGQPGSAILAGGTDLIPLMKEEIASPKNLIDISRWEDGMRISDELDGLHIGALVPLSTVASQPSVKGDYSALAEACKWAATPQLRNMGTIGGNLLQQTRCWYFRGTHPCWLKGGNTCFARQGENEYHAIFSTAPEASPCVSAHPSDPAAALLSLDASVRYSAPSGPGELPIEDLFALPDFSRRTFNVLPEGAVITEVVVPQPEVGSRSTYLKAMARASWGFALAGIAILIVRDGTHISKARIALTGVAPIPVRAREVEEQLAGMPLSDLDYAALADRLVAAAQPLSHNAYKIDLLRGLFKEAMGYVTS